MKTCPACQNQVPDNAQFCDQCGMRLSDFPTATDTTGTPAPAAAGTAIAQVAPPSATLPNRCPACGASYIPGEAFCGECGAALTAPASAAASTPTAAAAGAAPDTSAAAAPDAAGQASGAPGAAIPTAAPAGTPSPAPSQPAFITCPSCGSQQMAGQAYCDECGASLAGVSRAVGGTPAAPQGVTAAPVPSMPTMPVPAPVAPPPPPAQPRLVVTGSQAVINLAGRNDYLLGRTDPVSNIYPEIDLTPHGGEDGGVSRRHARITNQGGQWMVEDLNSTNGTFLNGQRMASSRPQSLKDGDALRLGKVQLSFRTG